MLGVWQTSPEPPESCSLIVDPGESTAGGGLLVPHRARRRRPRQALREELREHTSPHCLLSALLTRALSWTWQLLQIPNDLTSESRAKGPCQPSACCRGKTAPGNGNSGEVGEDLQSASVTGGLKLNFKCFPACSRLHFVHCA